MRKLFRHTTISVALGCLLGVPALQAQYSLSELSLEELMDIEVTLSTRQPEKVSSSAAAVTVVTRDELLRAGVRTLPDALRLVPGMLVGQIDGGKWIVTARGFAGLFANKLLVLIGNAFRDIVPDRLRVSLGAKVERNSFTGFEWQPNARLWYSPRPQHNLWLAVSRALRTPSRGDDDFHALLTSFPADSLFAGAPPTLVRVDGNPGFETERLLAVDAGSRRHRVVVVRRYLRLLQQLREPSDPGAGPAAFGGWPHTVPDPAIAHAKYGRRSFRRHRGGPRLAGGGVLADARRLLLPVPRSPTGQEQSGHDH